MIQFIKHGHVAFFILFLSGLWLQVKKARHLPSVYLYFLYHIWHTSTDGLDTLLLFQCHLMFVFKQLTWTLPFGELTHCRLQFLFRFSLCWQKVGIYFHWKYQTSAGSPEGYRSPADPVTCLPAPCRRVWDTKTNPKWCWTPLLRQLNWTACISDIYI